MSSAAGPSSSESIAPTSNKKRKASAPAKDSETAGDKDDESKIPKSNKACLNCRKQKMKCEIESEPPCRRCRNAKVPCLFKVRSNGIEGGDWFIREASSSAMGGGSSFEAFKSSVLTRLHLIETRLGMASHAPAPIPPPAPYPPPNLAPQSPSLPPPGPDPSLEGAAEDDSENDEEERGSSSTLPDLTVPLQKLWSFSDGGAEEALQPHTVETLWLAFAEHMPALHFSTKRIFLDAPTPILLAAVLYAASMQHTLAEFTRLSAAYRTIASRAIANLAVPSVDPNWERSDSKDLHNALGIVIMGLMCEAWVDTTGLWIAMAYQLILSNASQSRGVKAGEWRSLYDGLRVIDIEHASLRMLCPILPLNPPIPTLELPSFKPGDSRAAETAYTHLMAIMHVGLTHFSRRRLPTIMATVLGGEGAWAVPSGSDPPSENDQRVIKGWAKELDAWLIRYHHPSRSQQRGPSGANIILLQYQLHKYFVLSIYHYVQSVGITQSSTAASERKELLTTSRGALQLQRRGLAVWSNWDLVMITSAAHLLLDCMQSGVAEREGHINALRSTHQPPPNLRHTLAARLEDRLLAATTPPAAALIPNDQDYLSIFNVDSEAWISDTLNGAHGDLYGATQGEGAASGAWINHPPEHASGGDVMEEFVSEGVQPVFGSGGSQQHTQMSAGEVGPSSELLGWLGESGDGMGMPMDGGDWWQPSTLQRVIGGLYPAEPSGQ
ncbi:hypothetical protein IAT38_004924 [Cryptococcus sp. DSM 104549]